MGNFIKFTLLSFGKMVIPTIFLMYIFGDQIRSFIFNSLNNGNGSVLLIFALLSMLYTCFFSYWVHKAKIGECEDTASKKVLARETQLEKEKEKYAKASIQKVSVIERKLRETEEQCAKKVVGKEALMKFQIRLITEQCAREIECEKKILDTERKENERIFHARIRKLEKEYKAKRDELISHAASLESILLSRSPFKGMAQMSTEIRSLLFSDAEKWLRVKPNPALKSAEVVSRLKQRFHETHIKYKELEYKLSYILRQFPEISEYIDNDGDLIAVSEYCNYNELQETRDRCKDYMSVEEYNKLSEDERSQLALDRYLTSRKSKWQIGRDYEMSCAYQLMRRGYLVEMQGISKRFKDLGRDLIASKGVGGLFDNEILIIQCKNWSRERIIHENVIMQLYGTAIAYELDNRFIDTIKVVPILMIPPSSVVSQTAINFAAKLHVRIERCPNIEFPRIKCNINNGTKIYHLPFDQQYDRAEIKHAGEFYARTVSEATSKGFRRARRHLTT